MRRSPHFEPLYGLLAALLVACAPAAPPAAATASAPSPFVATKVAGLGDPEVIVENASDRPFTLVLTSKQVTRLEVPPHATRSLRLPPGVYAYEASAPNLFPAKGEQGFAADVRYLWKFVIVSKQADDPEFAGMGWHCFEVLGKPAYLVCARHKDQCDKARAEPGPPGEPPLSPCAEHKVVFGFTDEAKNVTISARTMEVCEQLRPTYLKQATDPAKVTACKERP